MRHRIMPAGVLAAAIAVTADQAMAHSFTQVYAHPVPGQFGQQATALALLLSCAWAGLALLFAARRVGETEPAAPRTAPGQAPRHAATPSAWRWFALALLALCIATGLAGTQNRFGNLGMSLFWIGYTVLLPVLTPLLGNLHARANPWQAVVELAERASRRAVPDQKRGDGSAAAVGCMLYTAIAWYALHGRPTPRGTAVLLLILACVHLAGACIWGKRVWFRSAEPFTVVFGLLARLRPGGGPTDCRLTAAQSAFAIVMLGTLLVDASYPRFEPAFAALPDLSPPHQVWWQFGALPLAIAACACAVAAMGWTLRDSTGRRTPWHAFAGTLVPVAYALFVAHYFPLLLAHASQLPRLLLDPFGWQWAVPAALRWNLQPLILEAKTVWNLQIALLLLGHLACVARGRAVLRNVAAGQRGAAFATVLLLGLATALTAAAFWTISAPDATSP